MRIFIGAVASVVVGLVIQSAAYAQIVGGGGIQQETEKGSIRDSQGLDEQTKGTLEGGEGLNSAPEGGLQGGGLEDAQAQGGIQGGGIAEAGKTTITMGTNTFKDTSGMNTAGGVAGLEADEESTPIVKYAWWTLGVAAVLAFVAWVVNNNISKPKMPGAPPKAPPGPTS